MSLNTNLLIIENVDFDSILEKSRNIIESLNLKILVEILDIDWLKKDELLSTNQNIIAVTYFNKKLIFENNFNKFSSYTRPCILQGLSRKDSIFEINISSTTDISNYSIYRNEKYFNKTFGIEDIDFSLFDNDNNDILQNNSCLNIEPNLEKLLDEFVQGFEYDDIIKQTFFVFECKDLESSI
jgi:hypothetical protein